jgi:hypothetical protein
MLSNLKIWEKSHVLFMRSMIAVYSLVYIKVRTFRTFQFLFHLLQDLLKDIIQYLIYNFRITDFFAYILSYFFLLTYQELRPKYLREKIFDKIF